MITETSIGEREAWQLSEKSGSAATQADVTQGRNLDQVLPLTFKSVGIV